MNSELACEVQGDKVVKIGTRDQPRQKRFKSIADSEIDSLEGKIHSRQTKKNTLWGVNLFQGIIVIE